ncbi:protocatechuate 3,4-dioxygenase subunit alpha [Raoultella planticola]|nr:protocatechuate 3,4-dioxygenase subunit alpha [Raoultella planticola]
MKDYLAETASQTAGPYVHIGLAPDAAGFHIFEKNFGPQLATPDTEGERITIEGRVIDGSGTPVRDVLLELWQANAAGRYHHPTIVSTKNRSDLSRLGPRYSDFSSGIWRFETIKPGAVVGRDGRMMAPHVNLWVVARGINIGLNTRMYFCDEQEANLTDPVLNLIEWEVRRQTLIAQREVRGNEIVYRFDIHLQGENETVFFDI